MFLLILSFPNEMWKSSQPYQISFSFSDEKFPRLCSGCCFFNSVVEIRWERPKMFTSPPAGECVRLGDLNTTTTTTATAAVALVSLTGPSRP